MSKDPCRVTSACSNCPFRKDVHPFLTRGRAEEIVKALREDKIFHCHKTVDYSVGPRSKRHTKDAAMCAGSMAVMLNERSPNLPMRLGVALGLIEYDDIGRRDKAFSSLDEFIEAQR